MNFPAHNFFQLEWFDLGCMTGYSEVTFLRNRASRESNRRSPFDFDRCAISAQGRLSATPQDDKRREDWEPVTGNLEAGV